MITTNIHNITGILIGPLRGLSDTRTYIRSISLLGKDGEPVMEITAFGKADDLRELQIEPPLAEEVKP
jgi:hypothetical protein